MPKIKIIAELGINHNGQMDLAKEMIFQSKLAGADFVKFQKRTVEVRYADILDDPRDDGNPYGWETQGEQKHGLEFNEDQYRELIAWCREFDIPWFASAWDGLSLEFLERFEVEYHKIASAMLKDINFVDDVAKCGKFTYISTGGCNMDAVEAAVTLFRHCGTPFALLHCVSTYPCKDEDCNINCIRTLQNAYPEIEIGYSGHEVGIAPSIAAMSNGATVIERHVTLDRAMYGSDQPASLEFTGLQRLVDYARVIEKCMGTGKKCYLDAEKAVMRKLRGCE